MNFKIILLITLVFTIQSTNKIMPKMIALDKIKEKVKNTTENATNNGYTDLKELVNKNNSNIIKELKNIITTKENASVTINGKEFNSFTMNMQEAEDFIKSQEWINDNKFFSQIEEALAANPGKTKTILQAKANQLYPTAKIPFIEFTKNITKSKKEVLDHLENLNAINIEINQNLNNKEKLDAALKMLNNMKERLEILDTILSQLFS